MADDFREPYWDKLSGAVKDILNQARRLSLLAKKPRVHCNHIMQALVTNYPEELAKVITHISTKEIKEQLIKSTSPPGDGISLDVVMKHCAKVAEEMGDAELKIHHLVKATADYCDFKKKTAPSLNSPKVPTKSKTPTLDTYGRDLTVLAKEGKFHQIIGREKEIDLLAETLCRVFKKNPLLVGSAGVGKTAVVEGLANQLAKDEIPEVLRGKRLIELNMGSLVAGTKYRGMFEERMMLIIKEASNTDIILFIDEFQSVVGAGVAENAPMDASTILLPPLARGELSCIGACTSSDYHKVIENNKALDRRFQPIRIPELSPESTQQVLNVLGPSKFEQKYNLKIDKEVYAEVVDLADRYMRNRCFPDKAIDILDQAVGHIIRKDIKKLTKNDIRNVIGSLTGLPVGKMEDELRNRLEGLHPFLRKKIIGQDHIIDCVVDIIWPKTQGVDLRPERPNGVFFFAGPTGVGKTEFARAMTEYLFGSADKMVRIDMSEYSEAHSISRLLGAPFGYKGFEEGSPVLNEIAEKPFCVLLLDEIEKAHPDVHRLFLQVFDRGVLTDTQRKHIFFSDVIIIMTSNVLVRQTGSIGYNSHTSEIDVRKQLTRHFAPEFLNRIDFIGLFNSLATETAQQIVEVKIIPLLIRIWEKKGLNLEFTNEAILGIAVKGCTEKWGARNLERTVDELINSPLTRFLPVLDDQKIIVFISYENEIFKFEKMNSNNPTH